MAPPETPRLRRVGRAAPLLLLAAGCGAGDAEPAWIHVAAGFDRARVEGVATREQRLADGRGVRVRPEGALVWIEAELRPADWERDGEHAGLWSAALPIDSTRWSDAEPLLVAGERSFALHRRAEGATSPPPAGSFLVEGGRVLLALGTAETPPEARVSVPHELGRHDGAAWRVSVGRRLTGEGLTLLPGERVELVVDVPPESALRFTTAHAPALVPATGEARFEVAIDGRTLLAHATTAADAPALAHHALALPPEGRRGARLVFSAAGDPGLLSFLVPVIGPAEKGGHGARPWGSGRPDLVVLLADTFRADNVAAYGGAPGLTPFLDELAGRALLFRRAWSNGTFTLATHAALFTGLFPRQAGVLGREHALSDELLTIAEHLRAHGYRTAAITDSLHVSRLYRADQGFEWFDELLPFDEKAGGLESTLQRTRALLEADDGRPLFLFVQSYETHIPYDVSAETRRTHGARLGIEGEWFGWQHELEELRRLPALSGRDAGRRTAALRRIEALYRGTAVDLDRGLRELVGDLEQRGVLAHGFLVFTSDHGEGFGEHDVIYHMNTAWEELARVPLFVLGPGVRPGVVEHAASSIDLPPTLAALAGAPARAEWLGRDLLELRGDRPALVFECRDRPRSSLAVVEGGRKLLTFEDPARLRAGELQGAFDLEQDPGERRDQRGVEAWPAELLRRHAAGLERLLVPVVGPRAVELDGQSLDELRAMGYGG